MCGLVLIERLDLGNPSGGTIANVQIFDGVPGI
jgi:hypothetical protein